MVGIYTTDDLVAKFLGKTASQLNTVILDLADRIARAEEFIDDYTNKSWKTRTVNSRLYTPNLTQTYDWFMINLPHKPLINVTELKVWNGGNEEDWLTTKTEGRINDYWFDKENGRIWIRLWYSSLFLRKRTIRVAYTYGFGATELDRSAVPRTIERAATLLVASDILSTEDWSVVLPSGEGTQISHRSKIELWEKEIVRLLNAHRSLFIGGM